jgi:hypothetical protein
VDYGLETSDTSSIVGGLFTHWQEYAEAVQHRVDTELRDTEGPNFPVPRTLFHIIPMELLCRCSLANFALAAHDEERSIIQGHEVGSIEVVRHKDPEQSTNYNRWDTFDDEDPSPGSITTESIHEADSISNETSNGTGDGGSDEKIADSKGDGSLVVEESQIGDETREKPRLEDAEEDTAC